MKQKKLTLIEIIIMILVIGILVGLAIPKFTGIKADAEVAVFMNDIDVVSKAIDEAYVKEGVLPIGEKANTSEPEVYDAIVSFGENPENFYVVDLSKTRKYHSKLRTKVSESDFFVYSMDSGNVFFTKGKMDGKGRTFYTTQYTGLSQLKINSETLINGATLPLSGSEQYITGEIPLKSEIKILLNGDEVLIETENVVFDNITNLFAGIKMKNFSSRVHLSQGENRLSVFVDKVCVTYSFKYGDSSVNQTSNPVAVITMDPNQVLTTETVINWSYENSTVASGRTIAATEWEGKENIYAVEGSYIVRLRIQDSAGVWSEWVQKTIEVISNDGIKQIVTDYCHSAILKGDGTLWMTGSNYYGQLGKGDNVDTTRFTQVLTDVKSVVLGNFHTVALKNDGSLWVSGNNDSGQLGTGDYDSRNVFVKVQTGVKSIAAGDGHTVLIKDNDTLWVTGRNNYGQLGTGNNFELDTFTQIETNVKTVVASAGNTLIIKNDNTLWAAGLNNFGQLGTNDHTSKYEFTLIQSGVKNVSMGKYHSLVLKVDDTLWAAGYNSYGQYGNGTTTDSLVFIQINSNVKTVMAGDSSSMILKEDGSLWASGRNRYGQFGTGSTANKTEFTQIASEVKRIAVGEYQMLLIKNDNTIWGSGYNVCGQLGLGDNVDKYTFNQINF